VQAPRPLLNARPATPCTDGTAVRMRATHGAAAGRAAARCAAAVSKGGSARYAGSTPARRHGSGDASETHVRGARCVCQANRRAEFRRWHVDDAEVYDAPGDVYTQLGDIWGVRQGRRYAVDVSRGVGKHVRVQLEHENGRRVCTRVREPAAPR